MFLTRVAPNESPLKPNPSANRSKLPHQSFNQSLKRFGKIHQRGQPTGSERFTKQPPCIKTVEDPRGIAITFEIEKRRRVGSRITERNYGRGLPLKTRCVTRRCCARQATFSTAFPIRGIARGIPLGNQRHGSPTRRIDSRERDRKHQLFTRPNDPIRLLPRDVRNFLRKI